MDESKKEKVKSKITEPVTRDPLPVPRHPSHDWKYQASNPKKQTIKKHQLTNNFDIRIWNLFAISNLRFRIYTFQRLLTRYPLPVPRYHA